MLIEPDVGGVGEAPVVANVDFTRVSLRSDIPVIAQQFPQLG